MTRNISRILVPTDFSAPSNAALEFAKTLAARFGASLQLLHVLEDPYLIAAFAPEVYAPPPPGLRESSLAGAQKVLAAQLTEGEQEQFGTTTTVLFGAPAQEIVDYAATHGIDVIVMGTHGRSGLAHLMMGSVAERVVRAAPCPVLTTRGREAEAAHAVTFAQTAAV